MHVARSAGTLFHTLVAAKIDPISIAYVFLTHAYMDHAGGLVTDDGVLAFPNAAVVIRKREHEFWSEPITR